MVEFIVAFVMGMAIAVYLLNTEKDTISAQIMEAAEQLYMYREMRRIENRIKHKWATQADFASYYALRERADILEVTGVWIPEETKAKRHE